METKFIKHLNSIKKSPPLWLSYAFYAAISLLFITFLLLPHLFNLIPKESIKHLPAWLKIIIIFLLPQFLLGGITLGIVVKYDTSTPLKQKLKIESFKMKYLAVPFILILFIPFQGVLIFVLKELYTFCGTTFPKPIYQHIAKHASNTMFLAMGGAALFLAPFIEEFIFRHIIFSFFNYHLSELNAAIIASLLFAMAHGSLSLTPIYFVLAILLQYLYIKEKSLYPSIIFHFSYNTLSFASMILIYRLK